MLNQINSQFLSNYNQQKEEPISLDNPFHNVTNGIVSNNILNNVSFIKSLKNKINSPNPFVNINSNYPQLQPQNQNSNINIQGEFDETNFIDMIRNISLEPSNLNRNNINSLGQSIYGVNTPVGIGQNPFLKISGMVGEPSKIIII